MSMQRLEFVFTTQANSRFNHNELGLDYKAVLNKWYHVTCWYDPITLTSNLQLTQGEPGEGSAAAPSRASRQCSGVPGKHEDKEIEIGRNVCWTHDRVRFLGMVKGLNILAGEGVSGM